MAEQEQLLNLVRQHEELWEWIRKLDAGSGTYSEVSKIAELLADRIAEVTGRHYSEDELIGFLRAGHEIISDAGEVAQRNLNDAAGIGLNPLRRKFPEAKASELVRDLSVVEPEMVASELARSVPTLMLSMVDDIVEYNRDFQAKAGLKPIIVRTWSGSYPSHDTKHTDWCHRLAGTYEYGTEPPEVYARHKGCRCRVEYFPSARAKGRITALAKGDTDRDSVLWNTRQETLKKRLTKAKRNNE